MIQMLMDALVQKPSGPELLFVFFITADGQPASD